MEISTSSIWSSVVLVGICIWQIIIHWDKIKIFAKDVHTFFCSRKNTSNVKANQIAADDIGNVNSGNIYNYDLSQAKEDARQAKLLEEGKKADEEKNWRPVDHPETNIIDYAKKSLDSLPAHMRHACIAEVEKLVWMPKGLSPYTGQKGHINAYGCSYDYPRLRAGVCFRDIDGNVYEMQKLLEERRNNPLYHMNWIKAQYYLYTCDKEEILKNYAKEIERLKESNERNIRARKSVRDIINYIGAEKAYYDRTTRH